MATTGTQARQGYGVVANGVMTPPVSAPGRMRSFVTTL
jgi:hypothetical protein